MNKIQPKDTTETRHFKGFTNHQCEFFPCHTGVGREFNCLFCYCPLIAYECPGPYDVYEDANGKKRKDCSACKIPHDGIERSWRIMQKWLSNPNIWYGTRQSPDRLKAAMDVEHPREDGTYGLTD